MTARSDALRSSFWLPSALAVPLAIGLAFVLTSIDGATTVDLGLFGLSDHASARAVLQTIATATVSVAGLSFSVTLVALTLAAQQLSPRVLRTFRGDRIAQGTLAGFLATFAYSLVVLARLGEVTAGGVPQLSVALAIVFALAAFGGFVAFIGDIVVGLQASTVIRRTAVEARQAIAGRHPRNIGAAPANSDEACRRTERLMTGSPLTLRADRAGYLTHVDPNLIQHAARAEALVVQRVAVGDFVVTGERLADVYLEGDEVPPLDAVREGFRQGDERTLVADIGLPIRQLADIALRALSPGVNDPTTAENAMGSLTDTLIRLVADEPVSPIRVDHDERPRLYAKPTTLDELTRLGFEQVCHASLDDPLLRARLGTLLVQLTRAAAHAGHVSNEAKDQLERLTKAS